MSGWLRLAWVVVVLALGVAGCAPGGGVRPAEPVLPARVAVEAPPAAGAPRVEAPRPPPGLDWEPPKPEPVPPAVTVDPELVAIYAARRDGERSIAAIDVAAFDPAFLRQRVAFATDEPPGTIIIDSASRHLFLVEPDGMATRYGVSIGREGFGWTGEGRIGRKARWPGWTPPPEMIARDPALEQWRDGMPGGPENPLGARALYVYFGEEDSLYRVHGTNEPWSIGRAASSGCFRMLNHDVIDLYDRVAVGARIIVR